MHTNWSVFLIHLFQSQNSTLEYGPIWSISGPAWPMMVSFTTYISFIYIYIYRAKIHNFTWIIQQLKRLEFWNLVALEDSTADMHGSITGLTSTRRGVLTHQFAGYFYLCFTWQESTSSLKLAGLEFSRLP